MVVIIIVPLVPLALLLLISLSHCRLTRHPCRVDTRQGWWVVVVVTVTIIVVHACMRVAVRCCWTGRAAILCGSPVVVKMRLTIKETVVVCRAHEW